MNWIVFLLLFMVLSGGSFNQKFIRSGHPEPSVGCIDVSEKVRGIKSDPSAKEEQRLVHTCCEGVQLFADVKVADDRKVSISGWHIKDRDGNELKSQILDMEDKANTRFNQESQIKKVVVTSNFKACFILE